MKNIYQVFADFGDFEPPSYLSPCSSAQSALDLALSFYGNDGSAKHFWHKVSLQRYTVDDDGVYQPSGFSELWCVHCDVHSYNDRDVECAWIRVGCANDCFEDDLVDLDGSSNRFDKRDKAMLEAAISGRLLFSSDYNMEPYNEEGK